MYFRYCDVHCLDSALLSSSVSPFVSKIADHVFVLWMALFWAHLSFLSCAQLPCQGFLSLSLLREGDPPRDCLNFPSLVQVLSNGESARVRPLITRLTNLPFGSLFPEGKREERVGPRKQIHSFFLFISTLSSPIDTDPPPRAVLRDKRLAMKALPQPFHL